MQIKLARTAGRSLVNCRNEVVPFHFLPSADPVAESQQARTIHALAVESSRLDIRQPVRVNHLSFRSFKLAGIVVAAISLHVAPRGNAIKDRTHRACTSLNQSLVSVFNLNFSTYIATR